MEGKRGHADGTRIISIWSGASFTEECHDHTHYFAELGVGQTVSEFYVPGSPIQTLDLVGQDDTGHSQILGNSDLEGIPLTRLVMGQNRARPTLPLYAEGDNTSAGRRPACSWPACGVNESQTMSPRRGA